MNEIKPKKMVSRSVAIALGIICIVLVAGLGGILGYYLDERDNTISSLNNQIYQLNSSIANLQSNVSSLNSTVLQQQSLLNSLEKFYGLTKQMFLLNPINSSGEWEGQWNQIATFNENNVSGDRTSDFSINSGYHLWRLNYTIVGNLWLSIVQDLVTQNFTLITYEVNNNGGQGTTYMFEYSISSYYIYFSHGSFTGNSEMTIEELDV